MAVAVVGAPAAAGSGLNAGSGLEGGGPTQDSLRAMTCTGGSGKVGVAERGSGSVTTLSVLRLLQVAEAGADGSTSDSSPTSSEVSV